MYVSFLFIIVHVQVQNESRSRCTRWYQAGQNLQRDFGRRYAAGKYKSFCSVDAIEIFIFRFSVQILSTVLTALTFIVYHYKIIVFFMVKIGYFYKMVDANQKWEVQEAIDWMKQMKDYKILWIEEPTNPDDVMGHAAIAEVRVKYAILNLIW